MSPTLRQIAEKLKVAPSTVSRALAQDSGVGEALAVKIRDFAEKQGYRPRPMRRASSRAVALVTVTPDGALSDETYQSRLLSSVYATVDSRGWHVLHEFIRRDSAELPNVVRENRVDGVLFSGLPSPELCHAIRRMGFPAVALNDLASRTGLPSVMADGAAGTAEIVASLAATGHRHVAMAATSTVFPTVAARVEAFRTASKSAGLDAFVLVSGGTTIQQGQVFTRQIMARKPKVTAIVYSTDRLAVGGLIELGRLGLSVPGDVSVVGHDNTGFGVETDPPLTSVDLHQKDMVETAFDLLLAGIKGDAPKGAVQRIVTPSIIWRGSSAGAPPN